MDVRFDPEQAALRDAVAAAVGRLGPASVAELDDASRRARLDDAVVQAGWRELRDAGDDGRPVASGVEAAIVAEELARGLADVAFLGPTLAAELRRLAGAPATEAPETVGCTVDLDALARVVDGTLPGAVAIDAEGSGRALVLVAGPDGLRLATVASAPADPPIDLTRSTWTADHGEAPTVLAAPAGVLDEDAVARTEALGLALSCADLVGTMRGALALGCAYAAERRQFGAPIGSFQAVQHLLADAQVAMEGSRSVAQHAAWAVDALGADDARAAAALAKAYCARAALAVCETVIQVHGGIGNTWECLAHVYLRRALFSIDLFGGVGPSLDRVLVHHGIGVG